MKNKKNWYKILSMLMMVVLLTGTIGTAASAKGSTQVLNNDVEFSEEDVELLAKSLELITETGQVTEENRLLGYNQQRFEDELSGLEGAREVVQQLEQDNLFVETPEPLMSTQVVACNWYLMKDKPSYLRAENTCIKNGLKSNYGPVTVASTIANLIADKQFTLAAKKILALGIRSNIAGIVVTLSIILVDCSKKMERLYPGKTNCY